MQTNGRKQSRFFRLRIAPGQEQAHEKLPADIPMEPLPKVDFLDPVYGS